MTRLAALALTLATLTSMGAGQEAQARQPEPVGGSWMTHCALPATTGDFSDTVVVPCRVTDSEDRGVLRRQITVSDLFSHTQTWAPGVFNTTKVCISTCINFRTPDYEAITNGWTKVSPYLAVHNLPWHF